MKPCLLLIIFCQLLRCSEAALKQPTKRNPTAFFESYDRGLAFSIELTLDHLISSVTIENGSTHALARVPGGPEYQSLMRRYLDLCHDVHLTQESPLGELQRGMQKAHHDEESRRSGLIRHGDRSWWDCLAVVVLRRPEYDPPVFDGDYYTGDVEADVLTRATESLKSATLQELDLRFNDMEDPFPWAYASIVTPDFLWTTIKPKPDPEIQPDGIVSWASNFDQDSFWFRHILRKFSVALYRNRFRRVESSHWKEILGNSVSTLSITPSSFDALSHTKKHHCSSPDETTNSTAKLCGSKFLSPTSIVVSFNNASLSLWLQGPKSNWTPWNTFPELGGHRVTDHKSDINDTAAHVDQIIADAVSDHIHPTDRSNVDLVLVGESWTEVMRRIVTERFRDEGRERKTEIKNVIHQPDVFAASKRSSRFGRYRLETWDTCYMLLPSNGDIDHDEL